MRAGGGGCLVPQCTLTPLHCCCRAVEAVGSGFISELRGQAARAVRVRPRQIDWLLNTWRIIDFRIREDRRI